MSGDQPRQPKDMPGLLKFCLEATRGEDAPTFSHEEALRNMDPERKQWLEEALAGMSVDVIQQLINGIKILNSTTIDLEDKEETLDRLEDWLGNLDMANNFHKIGGFEALKTCLLSQHPSLRTGAAHLLAEVVQNNEYCQEKVVEEGLLDTLTQQLDEDSDEACRVKALYAISCICRENKNGLDAFSKKDGWSIVLRAIQSDIPKLRTKGCFLLAAVSAVDARVVEELAEMGLVHQLAAILEEPLVVTHEHLLHALLTLVKRSEKARTDAQQTAGLETSLTRQLEEARDKEEYRESVDHISGIMALCFNHTEHVDR